MSSSKTIVRNTLFLYVRMFLSMAVSLYTSRVVLNVLGVQDFGIYNLVGGLVILFSFLNGAMSSTTQRYVNIGIASKMKSDVSRIFSVSINVHIIIAIIVAILSETVGLWFLNTKLNIPAGRMGAANIVYQFSVVSTIAGIMQVPYNAIILAYERLSFYAYLGIFETFAKFVAALLLSFVVVFDHLVLYGILLLIIGIAVNFIYYAYCKRKFSLETTYKNYRDIKLFKELLSFSAWMLFGQLAVVGATQGLNILLNIFMGVVANAAMSIANQVAATVFLFVSNFQTAFRPQLIQTYAKHAYDQHKKLILNTSKYSFFLMALLSAPVLYFTKDILVLWLGESLPLYLVEFVQVVIFISLIDSLSGPFWMSAQAIGSIKEYNIVLTVINLLVLPLAYLLLKLGYTPIYLLVAKFIICIVSQGFRYYFIHKYLNFNNKKLATYFISICLVFVYLAVLMGLKTGQNYNPIDFILKIALVELILVMIIFIFGVNSTEKKIIREAFKKIAKIS
jgi:O-antigen/teichoic acid export membrane protein